MSCSIIDNNVGISIEGDCRCTHTYTHTCTHNSVWEEEAEEEYSIGGGKACFNRRRRRLVCNDIEEGLSGV
jgi:hypothetical protein